MELPAETLAYRGVERLSVHATGFPQGIQNLMDLFPGISYFSGRYAAKRRCSVTGFMMAPDVVSTSITFPEW